VRCFGDHNPVYARYHDEEWGRAEHDDQRLFEMLSLEGMQAGLSWELILMRREGYRELFHNFDPQKVVSMSDGELEEVLKNPKIIRNRRKVYSVRSNARIFLELQEEFGTFDRYVWAFVDGKTIVGGWKQFEDVPCESEVSWQLAKDLKRRGMSFVGPKIVYSFMQAVGMVDDHLTCCSRFAQQ